MLNLITSNHLSQYHNISIKPNIRIDYLKNKLLQECNKATNVPVSFVSDFNIKSYFEVNPQVETSDDTNVNGSECVPITFVCDSMTSLMKSHNIVPNQETVTETKT